LYSIHFEYRAIDKMFTEQSTKRSRLSGLILGGDRMGNLEQRQRLKQLLLAHVKSQGLTGHGLGRKMGVSQAAAQTWLNGTAYPSRESRELIAGELGLSYEELQAHLEGRAIAAPKTADEVCRDIRLLSREDLPKVARVLTERMIAEIEGEGSGLAQVVEVGQ
jgi:transcriptional regulator with XRE-family HTH domain